MTQRSVRAPMASTVVEVCVAAHATVRSGQVLVVVEAMKMEHELCAAADGQVVSVRVGVGDAVEAGDELLQLAPALPVAKANANANANGKAGPADAKAAEATPAAMVSDDAADAAASPRAMSDRPSDSALRPDLRELQQRLALTTDALRPDAIERRRARGQRTARENIADLCDPGTFTEYGALAIAAQRNRRSLDDLIRKTPADGMVTGIGSVNGALHGSEATRCVVMAYDATVLAGTQGMRNHQKTDRMLRIAHDQRLPTVLFAEGGGGRPGDTDSAVIAGLHVPTFTSYARLSGRVPVVGIVSGRCFAGNAALLGCSDVIIATRDSNIGMGGPAMVEGGGLGVFAPEQIGPSDVQSANGVIDVLVADEGEAVAAAKRYLSFFQGRVSAWTAADQMALRRALPQNRVRVYDMRALMALVADSGSMLELRAGFGSGIHTALARIEGRAIGLIASNPAHLGGAIDADAADKAARFLQLCDAHRLPIVSLVDTPGFMVGPEVETRAQVRHVSRLFVVAAHLRVPFFAVVVRKGYGLGAMAMTGGGFHATVATAAWPSGEFGAMGLEGAVRLGYRNELAAATEGAERDALYARLVTEQYANGRAINMASTLEIDAVIDPAETRPWLARGLESAKTGAPRSGPESEFGGRFVDPW